MCISMNATARCPIAPSNLKPADDPAVIEQQVPTVNFTDSGPHTRITRWDLYPGCAAADGSRSTLCTRERPCDYADNNFERYYPVKTVDGLPQQRYQAIRRTGKTTQTTPPSSAAAANTATRHASGGGKFPQNCRRFHRQKVPFPQRIKN